VEDERQEVFLSETGFCDGHGHDHLSFEDDFFVAEDADKYLWRRGAE
jgi:hypothetical protein